MATYQKRKLFVSQRRAPPFFVLCSVNFALLPYFYCKAMITYSNIATVMLAMLLHVRSSKYRHLKTEPESDLFIVAHTKQISLV